MGRLLSEVKLIPVYLLVSSFQIIFKQHIMWEKTEKFVNYVEAYSTLLGPAWYLIVLIFRSQLSLLQSALQCTVTNNSIFVVAPKLSGTITYATIG